MCVQCDDYNGMCRSMNCMGKGIVSPNCMQHLFIYSLILLYSLCKRSKSVPLSGSLNSRLIKRNSAHIHLTHKHALQVIFALKLLPSSMSDYPWIWWAPSSPTPLLIEYKWQGNNFVPGFMISNTDQT